jgi:hypothetical protein
MTWANAKIKRIMIWTQQVRPVWKPWSNTIAYFPFEDDILDKVGSAVISATWTKQILWYKFDLTGSAAISNITNSKFCCFWIKFWATKSWVDQTPTLWLWELTYNYNHNNSNFLKKFSYQYSSSWYWTSNTYSASSWQRYLFAYWYNGTNAVVYVNGTKVMDVQTSLYSWIKWRLWTNIDETLSELIFEDRCRTEQEISNYYKQTKSTYWL